MAIMMNHDLLICTSVIISFKNNEYRKIKMIFFNKMYRKCVRLVKLNRCFEKALCSVEVDRYTSAC